MRTSRLIPAARSREQWIVLGEPAVVSRRIRRWSYVRGIGWRLDATDWVLDFDRLNRQGDLPGAYELLRAYKSDDGNTYTSPVTTIDHFLDTSMEYAECAVDAGCTEDQILRGEVPWTA